MIVLITGASHTGKTALAQKLLERTGYPYLSVDHLKMGLIRSGNTDLTPLDDDALTAYLWPIVREMIKTAIENGQNLTVEGCYVPFDWRKDFGKDYLRGIRFVCLAMTDAYIGASFDAIRAHASDIEARLDDGWCTAEKLKEENRFYAEGFRRAGEEIELIGAAYEKTTEELLERIVSGLGRSGKEKEDGAVQKEEGGLVIRPYTEKEIPDVLDFERRIREEEDVWGWEIDEDYCKSVRASFSDARFDGAISYLAYLDGRVVGRIDAARVPSRFDGTEKAYLDWICVLKSCRHRGVGQKLLETLRAHLKAEGIDSLIALTASNDEAQRFYRSVPDSVMRDIGIWIDIK